MTPAGEIAPPAESKWRLQRRWLVRSPNPLGDACMSLPAVRALKHSGDVIHITVTCRENLAPFWKSCPEVDAVIPFAKGLGPHAVGARVREGGPYDAGLLLPNSFRSALELRFAGIVDLVGYSKHQRRLLLKLPVPPARHDSGIRRQVDQYLDLVRAMGIEVDGDEVERALPAPPTPVVPGEKTIRLGICPGAEYGNAKRYPVERYAAAVADLRNRRPDLRIEVDLFGSPAERAIGEDLAARIGTDCRNRIGETDIAGLIEALRGCHLLATNDTGTMHLAAALGVPTVAIFGSTEPALTAPIGSIHRVIREKVDCSPCFLRECPVDYRCMLRIEPARVADELAHLLAAA